MIARITALILLLMVLARGQSTLTPTPGTLAFTWQEGTSLPSAKTLAVKGGSSTTPYLVTISPSNALWLSASPESGPLPAALVVRVNPSGLAVGTYTAQAGVTLVVK